jgi:hypothetical protein
VGIRNMKAFSIGAVGLAAMLLIGSAVAVAGPGKKGKGLVRGVHAEISLIKADGATDSFVVDRGKVAAESPTSVTLARKDGKSVTLGLDANTKIRGDIQVGKGAIVFSRGGTAFAVLAPRSEKGTPLLLAGMPDRVGGFFRAVHADVQVIKADGSTYAFSFDRGQVTAASETSVTIKRADGPSVSKTISSETKIRGKLVVGGRAAIFSQGSAAKKILAAAPKA